MCLCWESGLTNSETTLCNILAKGSDRSDGIEYGKHCCLSYLGFEDLALSFYIAPPLMFSALEKMQVLTGPVQFPGYVRILHFKYGSKEAIRLEILLIISSSNPLLIIYSSISIHGRRCPASHPAWRRWSHHLQSRRTPTRRRPSDTRSPEGMRTSCQRENSNRSRRWHPSGFRYLQSFGFRSQSLLRWEDSDLGSRGKPALDLPLLLVFPIKT